MENGNKTSFYGEGKYKRIKGPRSGLDNVSSRGTANVKNKPSRVLTCSGIHAIFSHPSCPVLASSCRSRRLSAQVVEARQPATLIGWTLPVGAILGGGEGVGAGLSGQSEAGWQPLEADQRRAEGGICDED